MTDEQLMEHVDAYVDEVWEHVVEDITSLVRIRSVEDLGHAQPGMPWGPASHDALVKGLHIASKLGLDAHECEGYIGYADLPGASQTQIATIAHTDVVPEGLGWTVDPFDVTRRDGYLLGRGVLDDKGPFVLSLYAAHYFVREVERTGKPLPYTLRCIVGNDEETSMADVDWYLEHYDAPAFCFTPDADFPLICGEKGIMHGIYRTKRPVTGSDMPVISLDGGTVANAIPGLATAVVNKEHAKFVLGRCTHGIESELLEDDTVKVTAHGIGGHAAMPEGTDNAIGKLVRTMLEEGEGFAASGDLYDFLRLVEILTRTNDGSALDIDATDEVFGALTLNAGVVRTLPDGTCTITIDVRYPTSISSEEIVEAFEELANRYDCVYEPLADKKPFYMDPSIPEIQVLLGTYRDYVNPDAQAFVIGGGTYARHFPRACAFGPHDPSVVDPSWVGPEHGADEGVSEEVLRRALKIYIVAISRLMELGLGE